jgi:hypothetical protein
VPGDPTDPASVGDALRDAVDAGAPLVLLAALAARHALPGGEGPVRSVRPAAPSGSGPSAAAGPHLALTALGRVSLPGAEPGVEYVIAPTPSGPQWATACVVEVGGALHVSATWYPEVLGDAAMRAALARAARDPVGLLS